MKQSLLLSFSFLLLICSCSSDEKKSAARIDIESQGVKIAYTDTRKGDTTLFFVHGWCINRSYWDDQVKFFSDRYRVVTIDLPGFGESEKNQRTDWSTSAHGKDVAAVMDSLDLKNVVLVGHSMAGDIVLEAAVDDPQRVIGLIGVDNFKNVGQKMDSATRVAVAAAIAELKLHFRQMATDYFNQALFYKTTDSAIRKRILNDVAHSDSAVAVACIDTTEYDEASKLAIAKKKIYLINSDYQPTDTTGFVTTKIPYELLVVHESGHFPMVEKPHEFNQLLDLAIKKIGMN